MEIGLVLMQIAFARIRQSGQEYVCEQFGFNAY